MSHTLAFADAPTVSKALPWPVLVDALHKAFAGSFHAPERHIHPIAVPGEGHASALLMPAWVEGDIYGVKLVNVFPGNATRHLPTVNGVYALFSAQTGLPLALMEGGVLTARRTVATSAMASRMLSRPDSRTLLVVGTGRLAPLMIEAHAAVRPIDRVLVWGRDATKAAAIARRAAEETGLRVAGTPDLAAASAEADIISCVTLATEPLVRGAWLKPGVHVDLVGAFKPSMREADAEAVRRADVFIDTEGGARTEAGDLIQAIHEGAFDWSDVKADLPTLCRDQHPGRTDPRAITLFKSVGCALEDLAAARLVHAAMQKGA